MTTTSQPSLLPLAKPTQLGLPWHGLVRNGYLQLSGGRERYYGNRQASTVGGFSGDVVPVVAPNNALVQEVADGDQRWLNYALLSGSDRWIGSAKLGENSWLYCDGACAWILDVEWDPTLPSGDPQIGTLNVYLRDTFGRFRVHGEPPHMTDRRKLASVNFDFTETYSSGATLNGIWSMPNETGSRCLFNIPSWPIAWDPNTHSPAYWLGAIVASISGTGSLEDGSVGDGISCSLSVAKQVADMTWPSGVYSLIPSGATYPCFFSGTAKMHYFDGDTLSMFVDYTVIGSQLTNCGGMGFCQTFDRYVKVGLFQGPSGSAWTAIAADTLNTSWGTMHAECDPGVTNGGEVNPTYCTVTTTGDYVWDGDEWSYGYLGGVPIYYGAEWHRTVYVKWRQVGLTFDDMTVTSFYGPSATHTGSDRPLLFANPTRFEVFSCDPVDGVATLETVTGSSSEYLVYV